MNRASCRLWAAVTGVLVAGVAGAVWAAEPTVQELQTQVKELQTQVASLQSAQKTNQSDLAATIEGVLRDAQERSQFLAASGGATAGYDNGFFIASEDHSFFLHPSLQFQPRVATSWRDSAKVNGGDDTQSGYEIRRMKLGFDGNLFTKDLTYNFLWATGRTDGVLKLEEAWAKYMFSDNWGTRIGQFKDPVAHEGLVSSKRLLASERSYIGDVLGYGDNFTQGASLIYQGTKIRSEVAFTDGVGSANTNFQDPPTNSTDFGAAARFEYKFFGDWKSYDDFSAMNNKDDLLVFGHGVDLTQNGDINMVLHTMDVQWENTSGLGVYVAYIGQYNQNGAPDGSDVTNTGGMIQGNYMLDKKWELFARYDYTHFDGDAMPDGSENNVHEITLGVNYYIHSHTAKITVDVNYFPNGCPIGDSAGDILTSNDEAEVVLRGQFQLLI